MSKIQCVVCRRDPARVNNEVAECSHMDCLHRRKAWSERPVAVRTGPWPKNVSEDPKPLDEVLKP